MKKIWEIYFSPTGTTMRTVHTVASALAEESDGQFTPEVFDFTLPDARSGFPEIGSEDLVVFGCPTYAGRLPNLMLRYLNTIEGNGALAIAVVTFGNRDFNNSLIELRHILDTHGFFTVAAGAFSCEHSFSRTLGAGRPDEADTAEMCAFAASVSAKLAGDNDIPSLCSFHVPGIPAEEDFGGYYQPQDRNGVPINILKVKPLTNENCTGCGLCARVCPMGAIDHADVSLVTGTCIKCGACVKKCPSGAKYYADKGYLYHKSELEEMYRRRAGNSVFL